MIVEIIIILAAVVYLAALCSGVGLQAISWCLDAPTLICILVLSVPLLFRKGMGKDFFRAFKMQFKYRIIREKGDVEEGKNIKIKKKVHNYTLGEMRRSLDAVEFMQKQILYAGIITMILPTIFVLGQLNFERLGPNLAVTLLSLLYTAVLELLLLPLQLETKRRIVNYMEEE